MPEQVKAVPPGFHTLTTHLVVRKAEQALEFYKNAFGAEVLHVAHMPDGKVMHASLRIGDSMLMLNDEFPDSGTLSPLSTGGSAGRTVAVNPVCPCAQHRDVFSGDSFRAGKCKLLVAASNSAVCHFDGNFSARNQAHAFGVSSQLAQAREEIIGCANIIPIIATVINLNCEPVPLCFHLCRLQE